LQSCVGNLRASVLSHEAGSISMSYCQWSVPKNVSS
jgi:hypothetical protein